MKSGLSNWEKVVGFAFGSIFMVTILVLILIIPEANAKQYSIFKTILALAAAGVGAILSGFISVEGKLSKISVRAGGAFALFVIIYFFNPAQPSEEQIIQKTGDNSTQIGINEGVINIGTSSED